MTILRSWTAPQAIARRNQFLNVARHDRSDATEHREADDGTARHVGAPFEEEQHDADDEDGPKPAGGDPWIVASSLQQPLQPVELAAVSCKRVGDAADETVCHIGREVADRILDGDPIRGPADHARSDDERSVRNRHQGFDDLERDAKPLPANARCLCSIADGL
jgi:hypothetical protein